MAHLIRVSALPDHWATPDLFNRGTDGELGDKQCDAPCDGNPHDGVASPAEPVYHPEETLIKGQDSKLYNSDVHHPEKIGYRAKFIP
jgi:hypothetical protein